MKSLDGMKTQDNLLIGLFQVNVGACFYGSGRGAPGGGRCGWSDAQLGHTSDGQKQVRARGPAVVRSLSV